MKLNLSIGLKDEQVVRNRKVYGDNAVHLSGYVPFKSLLLSVLSHPIVIFMMAAIAVSFVAALKLNEDEQIGQRVFAMPVAAAIATSFLIVMGVEGALKFKKFLLLVCLAILYLSISVAAYILNNCDINVFNIHWGFFFILLFTVTLFRFFQWRENKNFFLLNKTYNQTPVKVIRNNNIYVIERERVVVGDVVVLHKGEVVPADCEVLSQMNLSASDYPISSQNEEDDNDGPKPGSERNEEGNCQFLYKGCRINDGYCLAKVVNVGSSVKFSELLSYNILSTDSSSIKQKLSKLASVIQKCGYVFALLFCLSRFFALLRSPFPDSTGWVEWADFSLETMIVSTVIILFTDNCVINMLYSWAVAFNIKDFIKQGGLPRSLDSIYNAAAVDLVCLDLTKVFAERTWRVSHHSFYNISQERLYEMIAVNSNAFIAVDNNNNSVRWGNPLEVAELEWIDKNNCDYLKFRENIVFVDRRELKLHDCLATVIRSEEVPGKHLLYVKGDPDYIMSLTDMTLAEMNDCNDNIHLCINNGWKTVAFAYGIINDDEIPFANGDISLHNLNFAGFMAFEPTFPTDLFTSLSELESTGVDVKFIARDNSDFALAFAQKSGLLDDCDVYNYNANAHNDNYDKYNLKKKRQLVLFPNEKDQDQKIQDFYQTLKSHYSIIMSCDRKTEDESCYLSLKSDIIIASTGDDVNKKDNVNKKHSFVLNSFSIKNIADIIFSGRKLVKNIQLFILFFTTFAATTFGVMTISNFFLRDLPLSPVCLMWFYIVVYFLATSALISLPVLNKNDLTVFKNSEKLYDRKMIMHTFLFTSILTLLLLWILKVMMDRNINSIYNFITIYLPHQQGISLSERSIFFLALSSFSFWHLFNLRTFDSEVNLLSKFKLCKTFLWFSFAIIIGSFLILQFGYLFFNVNIVSGYDWIAIIFLSSSVLLFNQFFFLFLYKKTIIAAIGKRQAMLLPERLSSLKNIFVSGLKYLKKSILRLCDTFIKFIKYIFKKFIKLLIRIMDFIHNHLSK